MRRAVALLGAAHPGPALAVTVLAGLLGVAVGLGPADLALVVAAVLTGQLSIGWSNDLLDAQRDRAVGRTDKPLATGELDERRGPDRLRRRAASRRCRCPCLRRRAGPVHLLRVAAGWAYNLGLKSTVWSWAALRRRVRRPAGVRHAGRDPGRSRRCGCPPRARCSASAHTSSTRCPTSTTTPPPGCAGCRTASAPVASRSPPRSWSPPRW